MADDLNSAPCSTGDVSPLPVTDAVALVLNSFSSLLPGAGIPFDPSVPQIDGLITSSDIYKLMNLPGATEKAPDAKPEATDILGFLQPMLSAVSTVLMIFGPVKVIVNIIIAIINVLCAIPNPLKIAEAMVPLFSALLALVSLFPAAAMLLVLIQIAKTIVLILAGIILVILPKILELQANAQVMLDASSFPAMIEAAYQKICGIIQDILNDLGIMSPIQAILDLISSFAGAGISNICGVPMGGNEDANCCDDCPQIVRNPPSGLVNVLPTAEADGTFEIQFISANFSENLQGANPIAPIGSAIPMYRTAEGIVPSPRPLPSGDEPQGSVLFDIQSFSPGGFIAALDIGLTPTKIKQITESKTFEITFDSAHGLVVGNSIFIMNSPMEGRFDGEFVIDAIVNSKTISITDTALFANILSFQTKTFPISFGSMKVMTEFPIESVRLDGLPSSFPGTRTVTATLSKNILSTIGAISDTVMCSYVLIPREDECQRLVPFAVGCRSTVAESRSDFAGSMEVNNFVYTSSLQDSLGIPIPSLGFVDELRITIRNLANDPFVDPLTTIVPKIEREIGVWTDVIERALCASVSGANSVFSVSSQTADISGNSKTTLSFQPRNIGPNGGQPALIGLPSNVAVQCLFTTTHGELSATEFNPSTGTYTAVLSAKTTGTADLRAFFVTTDACSTAEQDAPSLGFPPKIIQVRFIDGSLRPRRQDRQYLPSAGGRRR
jgi:hypothetical protein